MSHDISQETNPTSEKAPVPATSKDLQYYPQASHPVPDPGVEEHIERYTDANKHAGRRAYAQVVGMLALVPLMAIAFIVAYFAIPRHAVLKLGPLHSNAQTTVLSLCGGLMVALIGFALIHWAKQIMNDNEIVDERHPLQSDAAAREEFLDQIDDGIADSQIKRRRLIGGALLGGLGLAAAPAVLLLSDMGPYATPTNIRNTIAKTVWAEGVRLVNDVDYTPIKASAMEVGQLVNGEPENLKDVEGTERQVDTAKAAIIVVRMDPASIKVPDSRKDWQVNGILAYSKICTHVGCPISLWERTTHHLLCPCHQSTFDLGDSGVVVFGPAARSLPQLPITVDSEGYLVAKSDFTVPVGPSYFERDSRHDFKKGNN